MTHVFNSDHDNPQDSQLIVALTGTPDYIRQKLRQMVDEIDSKHGKPIQGQVWSSNGSSQIATPMWKGKKW